MLLSIHMYEDTICMRVDTFEFVVAEVGSRISYTNTSSSKLEAPATAVTATSPPKYPFRPNDDVTACFIGTMADG